MAHGFYPIVDNPAHPINEEVTASARIWLSENIGRYSSHRCKRGSWLIRCISEKGATPADYEDFLKLFSNDPIGNTLLEKNIHGASEIVSDSLDCYFVCYNGAILPIGFLRDYYHEDFSSDESFALFREEIYDSDHIVSKPFKAHTLEFWHQNLTSVQNSILMLKNSDPFVFRSAAAPLPALLFRLIPTVILTILFLLFCRSVRLFEILPQILAGASEIRLPGGLNAYGSKLPELFTVSEYFTMIPLLFICNALLLVVLVEHYRRLICGLIFLVRWTSLRKQYRLGLRALDNLSAWTLLDCANCVSLSANGSLTLEKKPPISRRMLSFVSDLPSLDGLLGRASKLRGRLNFVRTRLSPSDGTPSPDPSDEGEIHLPPKLGFGISCVLMSIYAILNIPFIYTSIYEFFL